VQLSSTQILPYVAVNKDAFPTSPAYAAGCFKSVRLPKQAQLSRVILKSAIIRLSFALRSEAAQLFQPSRSIDLRFGTFHSGRALALRTLASTRDIPSGYLRGQQPWTDAVAGT